LFDADNAAEYLQLHIIFFHSRKVSIAADGSALATGVVGGGNDGGDEDSGAEVELAPSAPPENDEKTKDGGSNRDLDKKEEEKQKDAEDEGIHEGMTS
jgi:hypothetical protein